MLSYQIHRVEFLEMLLGAVKGPVRFGDRCIAVDEAPTGARLRFANGAVCDADVVIGADGIHSIVQREIGLTARPTSEGIVAYRGTVPAEKLSWAGELRGLNMWMGDGRSFICFPVSQGRLINIVAFVPSPLDMEETWFAPGDVVTLAASTGIGTLPSGTSSQRSITPFAGASMTGHPYPIGRKAVSRFLAMPLTDVPHFGQGAGQAIEDGFALAVLLEHARRDEISARLQAYQNLRLGRTSGVQAASRLAGRFYRSAAGNPSEQAERMREWMSAAAWIFPYDVEEAAAALLEPARSQRQLLA